MIGVKPLESRIVDRIIKRLRQHPRAIVRKRHGSQYGVAGDPDVYGLIWHEGDKLPTHFEIEVKRPGGVLTPLQRQRAEEWRRAGAVVLCATCVGDIEELFKKGLA